MAKKKLSAYNKHVQKQMKAGKTMKQAAASWKKKGKKSAGKKSGKKSSKSRSKSTRKRGGSKGMKGIATLVGVVGSAASMYNEYQNTSGNTGEKLLFAMTGYHKDIDNSPPEIAKRLVIRYGPAAAGVGISKAAGRFGVNQKLPKGVNL